MGSRPILHVKVPITIDTMLNLYRAEFKINSVSLHVNKALEREAGNEFSHLLTLGLIMNNLISKYQAWQLTSIRGTVTCGKKEVVKIFDHLGGAGHLFLNCTHPYVGNSLPSLFPFIQVFFREAKHTQGSLQFFFYIKHMHVEGG